MNKLWVCVLSVLIGAWVLEPLPAEGACTESRVEVLTGSLVIGPTVPVAWQIIPPCEVVETGLLIGTDPAALLPVGERSHAALARYGQDILIAETGVYWVAAYVVDEDGARVQSLPRFISVGVPPPSFGPHGSHGPLPFYTGTDQDFFKPAGEPHFASLRAVDLTFGSTEQDNNLGTLRETHSATRVIASTHRDEVEAQQSLPLPFGFSPNAADVVNALNRLDQLFITHTFPFPRPGLYAVECSAGDLFGSSVDTTCRPSFSRNQLNLGLNLVVQDQSVTQTAPGGSLHHTAFANSSATYFIPAPPPGKRVQTARFTAFFVTQSTAAGAAAPQLNGRPPLTAVSRNCATPSGFDGLVSCNGVLTWDFTDEVQALSAKGGGLLKIVPTLPPQGIVDQSFTTFDQLIQVSFMVVGLAANFPWSHGGPSDNALTITFEQALEVDLLDPVPDLLDGAAVTTDPGRLAQAGPVVRGAAADGVTRVVVRVRAPEAGTVELTLVEAAAPEEAGFLTKLGGATASSSVFVPTVEVAEGGPMAFAVYQAPSRFMRVRSGDADERDRQVSLRVRFTPQTGGASQEAMTPITIARPPVVLVHGLWGSDRSWDGFDPLITDPRFVVRRVNYQRNAAGFSVNAPDVGRQTRSLIRDYKADKHVAAVQADVVTHSMGGLLVRGLPLLGEDYFRADNFQQGDVHKLVNIGSPHFGSELAARLRTKATNFRCRAAFSAAGAPIHQGPFMI